MSIFLQREDLPESWRRFGRSVGKWAPRVYGGVKALGKPSGAVARGLLRGAEGVGKGLEALAQSKPRTKLMLLGGVVPTAVTGKSLMTRLDESMDDISPQNTFYSQTKFGSFSEGTMNAYDFVMRSAEEKMEKKAFDATGVLNSLQAIAEIAKPAGAIAGNAAKIIGSGVIGSYAVKKVINKILNDVRRKSLIEDLCNNDPMLKTVDRDQVLQWYATIYTYAPTMSLDKLTVRELLQQFSRFGRVDLQTLKTMAETEKALSDARSKSNSWLGGKI